METVLEERQMCPHGRIKKKCKKKAQVQEGKVQTMDKKSSKSPCEEGDGKTGEALYKKIIIYGSILSTIRFEITLFVLAT